MQTPIHFSPAYFSWQVVTTIIQPPFAAALFSTNTHTSGALSDRDRWRIWPDYQTVDH